MLKVPFVDLNSQHNSIREEISHAIQDVITAGDFILGNELRRFEENFAVYLGTSNVVGTGNGLDALRLALLSLGIGPGDEVIVPANTYIATALAVSAVGACPVLVEAEEDTFNLDHRLVEQAITDRTKAILVVHLYGQPAEMDPLLDIVSRYNLHLIEDACQAHGAEYKGRRVGTFGAIGCFSFYPSKNLGALGDAGAAVTSNPELAEKLRRLRNYGQVQKYYNVLKGINSRLDNIQAAVLNVKLKNLEQWNRQRMKHAERYRELLSGIRQIRVPQTSSNRTHVFHLYVIRCGTRDALQAFLKDRGIQTQIHYPLPIYRQQAYADLGIRAGAFPVTDRISEEILSLPMYPELQPEQIEHVAGSISAFYNDPLNTVQI